MRGLRGRYVRGPPKKSRAQNAPAIAPPVAVAGSGRLWLAEMRFRLWSRFATNLLALVGVWVSAVPAGCGDVGAPLSMENTPTAYINHYNSAGPEEKNRINKASSPAHGLYTQDLGPCIRIWEPPRSNPKLLSSTLGWCRSIHAG